MAPHSSRPSPVFRPHDRDLAKKFHQHHILIAENIMIAGLAKPQRGKMAACDIVDMHEIEPGIDKTRNAARCRFDDDPASVSGRAAQSAPSDAR